MPWAPELFSAPALQRLQEKSQQELETVPFFDGLMTGELDPLIASFAGEPAVHHPVRGRIKGVRAFEPLPPRSTVVINDRARARVGAPAHSAVAGVRPRRRARSTRRTCL
jgi:hypothetical protein